jgi:hypothetical protein
MKFESVVGVGGGGQGEGSKDVERRKTSPSKLTTNLEIFLRSTTGERRVLASITRPFPTPGPILPWDPSRRLSMTAW